MIRCAYPDKPFFESVAEYRVHGSEQKIREKLEKCLGEMDELRRIVPYTPMHELYGRYWIEPDMEIMWQRCPAAHSAERIWTC